MKKNNYYAAILTLYNRDRQIDEVQMREYIRFLLKKDVHGFFPCGTSAEYIGNTRSENISLLKMVIKENCGKKEIIPCASTPTLYQTAGLINEMAGLGVASVSVCPPYYTPLRQQDILDYYEQLLKLTKVQIYLYNIPAFTNAIELETFIKLLKHPRIIGIKDSSGSMKQISRYLALSREVRSDFRIMTGTDEMILPSLYAGCFGSVSALSGIIPEAHNLLYNRYETDLASVRQLQSAITRLAVECEQMTFPVGYKLALAARGFQTEYFRQNVVEQEEDSYFTIKSRIKQEVSTVLELVTKIQERG